jgi:tetratricopeptide (TPR) repeat protein
MYARDLTSKTNLELARLIFEAAVDSADMKTDESVRLIRQEAERRQARKPHENCLPAIEKMLGRAEQARNTWSALARNIALNDLPAVRGMVEKHVQHSHELSVKWIMEKLQEQGGEFARIGESSLMTTVSPVVLVNGVHPNSLRHLPPCADWSVLIDEVGSVFDADSESLSLSDARLGRMVALAVPKGISLPSIGAGFHATDAGVRALDRLFDTLLVSRVGIFGFTLKEQGGTFYRTWVNAVETMLRWVMRLLPLPERGKNAAGSVGFFIEQRGGMDSRVDLNIVCQLLMGELKDLDPERYGNIDIKARFITKSAHPFNGYIDTVAYTWGNFSLNCEHRLRQSGLVGHCLLESQGTALERVLLSLDRETTLSAVDWYELVNHLDSEPPGSFAREMATRLGERTHQSAKRWNLYLDYVHQLLLGKAWLPSDLASAVDWLEQWKPSSAQLSPLVRLHWHASRLSLANHMGEMAFQDARQCLELGQQLREEAAPAVCEAHLRLAVAGTNVFEFDLAVKALESWLNCPPETPGLRNWAKVQSAYGQLCAFKGDNPTAVGYFRTAIAAFERLSDPLKAKADIRQTRIYHLIADMDTSGIDPEFLRKQLQQIIAVNLVDAIDREFLADPYRRYEHHVLLRAMLMFPSAFHDLFECYLHLQPHWQSGEHHPWPVINAYRGFLLQRAGDDVRVTYYLNLAVRELMRSFFPLLTWFGIVFAACGRSLGIPLDTADPVVHIEQIAERLPRAPVAVLRQWVAQEPSRGGKATLAEVMSLLKQCCPFNFH